VLSHSRTLLVLTSSPAQGYKHGRRSRRVVFLPQRGGQEAIAKARCIEVLSRSLETLGKKSGEPPLSITSVHQGDVGLSGANHRSHDQRAPRFMPGARTDA